MELVKVVPAGSHTLRKLLTSRGQRPGHHTPQALLNNLDTLRLVLKALVSGASSSTKGCCKLWEIKMLENLEQCLNDCPTDDRGFEQRPHSIDSSIWHWERASYLGESFKSTWRLECSFFLVCFGFVLGGSDVMSYTGRNYIRACR